MVARMSRGQRHTHRLCLPGVTTVEQVVGEAKVRVRPMKDGLRVSLRNLTERAILVGIR